MLSPVFKRRNAQVFDHRGFEEYERAGVAFAVDPVGGWIADRADFVAPIGQLNPGGKSPFASWNDTAQLIGGNIDGHTEIGSNSIDSGLVITKAEVRIGTAVAADDKLARRRINS